MSWNLFRESFPGQRGDVCGATGRRELPQYQDRGGDGMREQKKTRPAGGTAEQADQEKRRESGNSQCHSSTGNTCGQDDGMIYSLLLEGAENAVTAKELAKMAGLPNVRQLQEEIARERDAGAVILSTCRNGGGYYLPAEGDTGRREIEEYIRTLKSRALNTLRAIRSARAALSDLDRSRG